MQLINWISTLALAISMLTLLPVMAFADTEKKLDENMIKAAAAASLSWVGLLDKGSYAESWSQASAIMKLTIHEDEWVTLMQKTRKPLGSVRTREVVDIRTAKNPHGLPAGDYVVMFYKTAFSQKASGYELVTLFLEDGQWRVVTYQVE